MIEAIRKLLDARDAMKAADAAHGAMYATAQKVDYNDPDQEKYIRYEVEKTKRCKAAVAATEAFHRACLAFAESVEREHTPIALPEVEQANG